MTFGVASAATPGHPSTFDLFGFALSGVAAFSLLNLLVVSLLRTDPAAVRRESARALLIATATDFLAVGAGVGAAIWLSESVKGTALWLLSPLIAGVLYVLVQAIELAAGQRRAAHDQHNETDEPA